MLNSQSRSLLVKVLASVLIIRFACRLLYSRQSVPVVVDDVATIDPARGSFDEAVDESAADEVDDDMNQLDQKANTPRSKHSATEQRRRSKINDRFQMLRELIPHSDQKSKTSFLLGVVYSVSSRKGKQIRGVFPWLEPCGHYIQHQPVSAYYQVYPSQQQQQQHPQLDQQYPVYYMPSNHAQQSYVSMQQPTYSEPIQTANYPTRSQAPPPTATMINAAPTYPPNRTAPQLRPTPASPLIQIAATPNQHQQQYVGYSQVHHPYQSIAPNAGPTVNYAYEYAHPSHAQVYYTQPYAPSLAVQYQTMTAASAPGLLEASSQPAADQMKQQLKNPQAL